MTPDQIERADRAMERLMADRDFRKAQEAVVVMMTQEEIRRRDLLQMEARRAREICHLNFVRRCELSVPAVEAWFERNWELSSTDVSIVRWERSQSLATKKRAPKAKPVEFTETQLAIAMRSLEKSGY